MQFHHQRESVEAGAIRVAGTFDRLVEITALPRDALAATLAEVNDVLAGRSADRFGRNFGDKAPREPPYLAVKVTGALFHTQGGLVVDTGARVLRKGTRRALPNLFAGGGAARGLSGPSCWGYTCSRGQPRRETQLPFESSHFSSDAIDSAISPMSVPVDASSSSSSGTLWVRTMS